MGTLADSLFSALMSWVRALVSGIWALFSSERTTVLEFLGRNWIMIAVALIAAGLVIDWLIWLVRWQPYHIWAQRVRRFLRLEEEEDEEDDGQYRAHAAVLPERRNTQSAPEREEDEPELYIDEAQAQQAIDRASEVPDEDLGVYPGMRYGAVSSGAEMGGTQRYSALTTEGPGSAEVARRRAEIDAWQQQMQEEARRRAQAERAAREAAAAEAARIAEQERLEREAAAAEAARIAEQERLAREAAEAEAARIAEEERLEQERLAQEEYARQMAEYELAKAQYERELAEYERQKAEYDAQMAQIELEAQQNTQNGMTEAAQELAPKTVSRRRRAAQQTYSDVVQGDMVTALPDPPAWPDVEEAAKKKARSASPRKEAPQKEKKAKEHRLLSRMAHMIEPQEDEIASMTALPPRVDMHDAYKPAKTPQKAGRRKR